MSKQWGHGFNSGVAEGIEFGNKCGEVSATMNVSEHVWHCVSASIEALERGDDARALGILRTMKYMLASFTGRDQPEK